MLSQFASESIGPYLEAASMCPTLKNSSEFKRANLLAISGHILSHLIVIVLLLSQAVSIDCPDNQKNGFGKLVSFKNVAQGITNLISNITLGKHFLPNDQ